MKLICLEHTLDELLIAHYPDSCNPDSQIHFDVGDRGFYFETMFPENPRTAWALYEVGPSTVLGKVSNVIELEHLIKGLK
jgi:hypothetical protein